MKYESSFKSEADGLEISVMALIPDKKPYRAVVQLVHGMSEHKERYIPFMQYREFDSWISEKSTCRSHKTCFFCVKFLVFIYCILLQCVVKYNKGGILHASYYIEI